jgi:predicted DNA-binding transcriptional regulator AlpA
MVPANFSAGPKKLTNFVGVDLRAREHSNSDPRGEFAMSTEDRLIGTEQVAERLNLHKDTVIKRWKSDPKFPQPTKYQKRGRLFWRASAISEYVATFGKDA